jgi:heme/copper-type cytochrome/quinol oxidase subunit 2
MNFFMALVVAVSAWMTFSVLNELASAKDGKGCCQSKDCGEGMLASLLWWMNIAVALVFTIYVLMELYDEYGGVVKSRAVSMMRKNPVTKSVQMVFGN